MSELTIHGLVATTPRHVVTQEGLPITSFRIACESGDSTNWYTVTSFKQVAVNVATSVGKGDRVVVVGEIRVRDWDNGERAGTSVEIEASHIGHDLAWGTTVFVRTVYIKQEETNEENN
jgi:single-strand DNA-binding protein